MARARNLKPGFFTNEDLAECSPWARLCFAGLWTLADREGRLEDRPKRIKGQLFAFDSVEVEPLLAELEKHHFILRYQARDGRGLIQVVEFSKHQNPHHREPESDLPPPQSPGPWCHGKNQKPKASGPCDEPKAQGQPEASTPRVDIARGQSRADSGTLIPEHGFQSPEPGDSGADAPGPATPAAAAPATRGSRLPADWALPKTWGDWALAKYPHWTAETVRSVAGKFRNHWVAKTGKDATKLDWKATWENWVDSGITQRENPPPVVAHLDERRRQVNAAANAEAKRMLFGDPSTTEVLDA